MVVILGNVFKSTHRGHSSEHYIKHCGWGGVKFPDKNVM